MKMKFLAFLFVSVLSLNAFAEEAAVVASDPSAVAVEAAPADAAVEAAPVEAAPVVEEAPAPVEEKSWWESWFE